MPIAVIEAQVAGIPAVVTDVIGNRDVVVSGETGYVCGDEDGLASRLQQLADDTMAREALGRRARELSLVRFDVERLLDQLIAAYSAAIR